MLPSEVTSARGTYPPGSAALGEGIALAASRSRPGAPMFSTR
jgi:hypothetical protein